MIKSEPLNGKLFEVPLDYDDAYYGIPTQMIKVATENQIKSAIKGFVKEFDTDSTMFDYPFIMEKLEKWLPDVYQKLPKQKEVIMNKCYSCGKEHDKVAFCNKCEKDLTDVQKLKYLEVPLTDIALQEIHKMKKRLLEND